jgi:hypothetical protein
MRPGSTELAGPRVLGVDLGATTCALGSSTPVITGWTRLPGMR